MKLLQGLTDIRHWKSTNAWERLLIPFFGKKDYSYIWLPELQRGLCEMMQFKGFITKKLCMYEVAFTLDNNY